MQGLNSGAMLIPRNRLIICFALICIALGLPRFSASILNNLASLLLERAQFDLNREHIYYPYWRSAPNNALVMTASELFSQSQKFDPSGPVAWGRLRTALALGDSDLALAALASGKSNEPFVNRLYFLDTLVAYSRTGDDLAALGLYARYQAHPFAYNGRVISDTVGLAYLHQAREEIQSGRLAQAVPFLQQALILRPFDLYANFWLWKYALQTGDDYESETYLRQIMFFPVEAVDVQDERLLELIVEVYPDLIKENLWGCERGRNLARYWAWRYENAPAFRRSLDQLAALFPGERLTQLQPQSPPPPAPEFQETERAIMAQMLGLPADVIKIGSNLLDADTLVSSAADAPAGWYTSGIQAPFVAGRDQAERPGAVRLSNLWWPLPAEQPYAEYMTWVNIPADAAWLAMSVEYRVDGLSREADIGFIGLVVWKPGAPQFAHLPLTSTNGQWLRAIVVGQSLSEHSLGLVLRNYGTANVWFRNAAVQPLMLTQMPINCVEKPCEILSAATRP